MRRQDARHGWRALLRSPAFTLTAVALGARSRDVVWHVMRGSLTIVVEGALLGEPLTFAGGRVVSAMLFGVRAHDPMLLIGAALVLAGAAIAASAIPAARAARIHTARPSHLAITVNQICRRSQT